jgi:nucleotide-binding universal stress UspA family protein
MARSCLAEVVFYTGLSRARVPVADLPDPVMSAQWDSLDDERLLAQRLHAQAQQIADGLGVQSRSVIATGSEPVRSIVDAAQANYCDVIVAANERSNAVVRLLNGSFIPGLVTASPVPVMVCSPRPSQGLARGTDIGRILIILEDSDTIGAARTQGLDLARELGADLLFAHLTPPGMGPMVDVAGLVSNVDDLLATEIQLQSQRLLAAACRLAARMGLTARGKCLPAGMTAKDIARMAGDEACDLIVVGHRGSNAVMRLLTGSLIPGLITAATIPVLICREYEHPPKRRTPRRRLHRHRGTAAAAAAHAAQLNAR